MGYDVFVSYVRQRHHAEVKCLTEALRKQGINAFLDEEDIETGDAFPDRLGEALNNSLLVLIFIDE